MLVRTLAAATGLSALVACLGTATPPAAAHLLYDAERPPYCQGCAREYLRWRRIFERTEPWYVYQRELHETIPFLSPGPITVSAPISVRVRTISRDNG